MTLVKFTKDGVEYVDSINILKPVMAAAARAVPRNEDDYLDGDGFLCCGKCHTRKECEITIEDLFAERERILRVPSMCKCRQEAYKAKEEEMRRLKEMEVIRKLKRESLMDNEFKEATFENCREDKYNSRNLSLCRRYAHHFDEMLEKNQGLLFYGNVGAGKTYAAACIANYLLARRVPVVMTSFVKLLNSMQGFENDNEKLIARLNRAKLLIIDDLGAERGSDFALEKVYNIVDSRHRAKKPVIITTNLTLQTLEEPSDIRYSRIYDRLIEMCYPMRFDGESWRRSNASKRFREMANFLDSFGVAHG